MGIAATSFGGAIYGSRGATQATAAQARALATVARVPGDPSAQHADTLAFLERCHALGASGVQAHINGDLGKLRARAEELGMWVEGMVSARTSTPEQFESAIRDAEAADSFVARDGMLSGRRYESFTSLHEWNAWRKETFALLDRIVPLLEKHKFTLAIENHKDWTAEEYVDMFERYSSEYFGACIDFGNNISLLDDPMELIEAAAPYVKATHIKDIGVMPARNGFDMSEVPLGSGILDLPRMIAILQEANPRVRFSLEMITRDPLNVPCLVDGYWTTFPERKGRYLARALRYVSEHRSDALPAISNLAPAEQARIEEGNIRACFAYAEKHFSPAEAQTQTAYLPPRR